MSKKVLNVAGITNELEGASLFFNKPEESPTPPAVPVPEIEPMPAEPTQNDSFPGNLKEENAAEPRKNETVHSRTHAPINTRKNESVHARMHARMHAKMSVGQEAPKQYDLVETIRKSVKHVGKEECYMRLTPDEKGEITKIVFTFNELYSGEGRKISANDVGRIAIHYLLNDYRENGLQSLLSEVLAALNA